MSDDQSLTEVVLVATPPLTSAPPPAEASRIPTIPDSHPRGEPGFLIRAVWFIFIGWWLGAIYMGIAWSLCVILITLPVGLWLFNRVGAVKTLLRY
jgi:hypothetical protein